jgi:uncharacterized protein YqkB
MPDIDIKSLITSAPETGIPVNTEEYIYHKSFIYIRESSTFFYSESLTTEYNKDEFLVTLHGLDMFLCPVCNNVFFEDEKKH